MSVSALTSEPQTWAFFGGWLVVGGLLTVSAKPWSNTWLFLAIASFAMPLLGFLAGASIAARDPMFHESDAAAAGAAIGSLIIGGVGAFFGFFLGIIFALLAYFTRKGEVRQNTEP